MKKLVNNVKTRIAYKTETGYKLELLSPEKMKLLKRNKMLIQDKDGENVPKLKSAGVVLVHCNLVNNNYQQASKASFKSCTK